MSIGTEPAVQIEHRPLLVLLSLSCRSLLKKIVSQTVLEYRCKFLVARILESEAVTATITAIPNTNYRFNRWTGNIEQNPYTLTVTEDLDLEAEFESTL